MAREPISFIADMTPDVKRRLMTAIGALSGFWEVDIKPRRGTITQRQRSYYFSCICAPMSEFLKESGWKTWHKEFCHRALKDKFLRVESMNPDTGEVLSAPGSIMDLSVGGMADYIDQCIAYLAEEYGVICAAPDPAWRQVREREAVPA